MLSFFVSLTAELDKNLESAWHNLHMCVNQLP
jgi:hypothetical protein